MKMLAGPFARVLLAAAALRAALIVYSGWQDAHSTVRFTDVDYDVVTDGARALAAGARPRRRRPRIWP